MSAGHFVTPSEFVYEDWVLRRSTANLDISAFNCGDNYMNQYFRRDSAKYRKYLLVQSYHFCPVGYEEDLPVMLVDLCNDTIMRRSVSDNGDNLGDHRGDFRVFPALKIAHLGRDVRFRGYGLTIHLMNALKLMFSSPYSKSGCRFFTLDAYRTRLNLYQKCGFVPTLDEEDDTWSVVSMFFDLLQFKP